MDKVGLHTLDRVSLGFIVPTQAPASPFTKVRAEFMFLPPSFPRLCSNVEWLDSRRGKRGVQTEPAFWDGSWLGRRTARGRGSFSLGSVGTEVGVAVGKGPREPGVIKSALGYLGRDWG